MFLFEIYFRKIEVVAVTKKALIVRIFNVLTYCKYLACLRTVPTRRSEGPLACFASTLVYPIISILKVEEINVPKWRRHSPPPWSKKFNSNLESPSERHGRHWRYRQWDRKCNCNVTVSRVSATIVAVEKQ